MRSVDVLDASQVAEARRAAVAAAQGQGFGEQDAGRVAIVATELATNLVKHGGGGVLLIGSYDDATGTGVECLALDKGAGMADVAVSSRDGHSTAGSPGNGLGAVFRGSHASDIYSAPGLGTAVLARLQVGQPVRPSPAALPGYGAVSVPMAGEEACGDGWCKRDRATGFTVMVADGLGHGPVAAEAAHAASRVFLRAGEAAPSGVMADMHAALRSTRGAAVAIAQVEDSGAIVFAGVGNIAATIVMPGGAVQRMVSHNGTVGHIARHMRDFSYAADPGALMILASDGIATGWRLDAYPGLMHRHPSLIAGVLYRDFNRGRDDATVLVCRIGR